MSLVCLDRASTFVECTIRPLDYRECGIKGGVSFFLVSLSLQCTFATRLIVSTCNAWYRHASTPPSLYYHVLPDDGKQLRDRIFLLTTAGRCAIAYSVSSRDGSPAFPGFSGVANCEVTGTAPKDVPTLLAL